MATMHRLAIGRLVYLLAAAAALALGTATRNAAADDTPRLEELAFVTSIVPFMVEDCGKLSVKSLRSLGAVFTTDPMVDWRNPEGYSAARLAAAPDFSRVVAALGSGSYPRMLTLIERTGDAWSDWQGHLVYHDALTQVGGLAIMDDGDTLLVATSRFDRRSPSGIFAPFAVEAYALSQINWAGDQWVLGPSLGRTEVPALAAEILAVPGRRAHVVTEQGDVLTLEVPSLREVETRVTMAKLRTGVARADSMPAHFAAFLHADLTADGRYLVSNRGMATEINVVDLVSRTAQRFPLGDDLRFVGGIAVNKGWVNSGLLAVYSGNYVDVPNNPHVDHAKILVYDFDPASGVSRRSELSIAQQAGDPSGSITGGAPRYAIAWSASGDRLLAAHRGPGVQSPEDVVVVDVADGGLALSAHGTIAGCSPVGGHANDILTANGVITPPPPPTLTPTEPPAPSTPSPTLPPSETPTRTASPPPSATSTPPPSPTTPPRPIYLPLALHLRCEPAQQRVDLVLVLDASSSMAEPTRSGRPKIDAALDAARAFLGLLALGGPPPAPGQPVPEGDQAALVAFHADAWLLTPLSADRAALDAALETIALGQQTRLDRAVAVGAAALADATRRRPGNLPVLVLLTDGRANPVLVDAAVAEAAAAKAAGVTLFTIGLGEAIEADALAAMASTPTAFLRAPDGEDLAAAYAQVARRLPCPSPWPAHGR